MLGRPLAFGVLVTVVSLCVGCRPEKNADGNPQEESVSIPLDRIWAYRMPETRNIGKLETYKAPNYAYGPLVAQIRRSLSKTPAKGEEAKAGFAVLGTGMEALRRAHAVLVENKRPRQTFPAVSAISIVFFSYQFGPYVHLHSVEHRGSVVYVKYRFVPHETEEVTEHIALIPLGQLPVGKISVKIVRTPMEKQFAEWGFKPVSTEWERRVVCKSFSFSISERK